MSEIDTQSDCSDTDAIDKIHSESYKVLDGYKVTLKVVQVFVCALIIGLGFGIE